MVPIIPPVNAESTKESIANLHEALHFLGAQINPAEIQNKDYNDTTRRAVITLQRKFHLNETDGFVGEHTAHHFNKLLKEKGAFEGEPGTGINIVKGRVVNVRGVLLKSAKVVIYSTGLEQDKILGETLTDQEGNYTFSYPSEAAGNLKY